MPKFSIIVPVYNSAAYLPACLDSVLRQTVQDFELLLVDDGSTDNSAAICDAYAAQHAGIRVFHRPNGGAAGARNTGLENAAGEYVLFFDSDDTVEPDTLERCQRAIAESGADLVIFGMAFDHYTASSLVRTENLSCGHSGVYTPAQIAGEFSAFFEDNALSSACNKVFAASIIRNSHIRFPESVTLYEDLDFVLSFLEKTSQLFIISLPLYHYRLHTDDNHFHKLVKDFSGLSKNTDALLRTVFSLQSSPIWHTAIAVKTCNVYMQLVSLHFFLNHYSYQKMCSALQFFCDRPVFYALAQSLTSEQQRDLPVYCAFLSGRYLLVYISILRKKLRSCLRKFLKKCCRLIGYRR